MKTQTQTVIAIGFQILTITACGPAKVTPQQNNQNFVEHREIGKYSCPTKNRSDGTDFQAGEKSARLELEGYFVTVRSDELMLEGAFDAWIQKFNFHHSSPDWIASVKKVALDKAQKEFEAIMGRYTDLGVNLVDLRNEMHELLTERTESGVQTAPRDVRSQFLKGAIWCELW